MTYAIHFICRPEGIGLKNVTPLEKGIYQSTAWAMSMEDAKKLVAGWIYLHDANKKGPSRMGGVVLEVFYAERPDDVSTPSGIGFVFQIKAEGRGQKWRGADHAMAHSSGLVEANLPHET